MCLSYGICPTFLMCLSLEEFRQKLLGLGGVAGFLGGSSRALKLSLKECLKTLTQGLYYHWTIFIGKLQFYRKLSECF